MQLACPSCLTANRVPPDRLSEQPFCGRCGAELAPAAPVPLDDGKLSKYLARTNGPVLLDFWAQWCAPCHGMAPQFAAAAAKEPSVRFVKVDIDSAPDASARFAIRSVPTLVLTLDGREIARRNGTVPARELLAWVQQTLATAQVSGWVKA